MSIINPVSPRDSATSEQYFYDDTVSRESQPDNHRIGEFMKRNCITNPMIPKDLQTLNLLLNDREDDEEQFQPRKLFHDNTTSQLHHQYTQELAQNPLASSANPSKIDIPIEDSNRNANEQFFSIREAIASAECIHKNSSHKTQKNQQNVELSSAGLKDAVLRAERTAIIKNTRYENYLSTRSDIKIHSLRQALNLVVIVSNFIDTIKQFGTQYKFKRLNKADFIIIGDPVSDYDYYFNKNLFLNNGPSALKHCIIHFLLLLDKTPFLSILKRKLFNEIDWSGAVILPNSTIKIIWDSFIFALLTMNIFYVPIKITWEGTETGKLFLSSWVSIFLNDIPGWAFLGDLILNFNTAFYSKGAIICKRQEIVKNYLKTKFLGDLLVVIPFIVSLRLNLTLLNAVLLLRTNKMFKMATYFEQLVNFKQRQAAFYNLSKLVFMIIFVAHFCGCMFFLVASLESSYNLFEKTWVDKAGITNADWSEQYITSLYWAVITMITIGYGDITPITTIERIFVILITLLSCGVFAYSLNQIGILIQVLTQSENQISSKMGLLVRHLKNRGVSNYLQMQVRKYFEYWHQGRDESEGEQCDLMIESLSANLRMEVQNDIRYRLINQMQLLKSNFSTPFLKKLSVHIKTKRTKPEEILIEESNINDKLYYLVKGIVNASIAIEKDGVNGYTTVKPINPNSLFDQVSFMGEQACLTAYRSLGSCTLYYICKEDFLKEINNFPLDKERYQYIKDNINIYRSQRNIGTSCTFCNKHTHCFDRCPYIKYIPYAEKQLAIYRASVEQIRKTHQRRSAHSQALSLLCKAKERAVNYLIENNPFSNEEDLIERLELVNQGEEEFLRTYSIPITKKEYDATSAADLSENSETNGHNNGTNQNLNNNDNLANNETCDVPNNNNTNHNNSRRNSQNSIASNWEYQATHNQGAIPSSAGTPRNKNNSQQLQQQPTAAQIQNNSSLIQSQYQQLLLQQQLQQLQQQQQLVHSQQNLTQSPTISPNQSPLLPNPFQFPIHLSPFENVDFNTVFTATAGIPGNISIQENNTFTGPQGSQFQSNQKQKKHSSHSQNNKIGRTSSKTKFKPEEQFTSPQLQQAPSQQQVISKLRVSQSLLSQNSMGSSKPYVLVPSNLKRIEELNVSPEFAQGDPGNSTNNNNNNNIMHSNLTINYSNPLYNSNSNNTNQLMSPEISNFLASSSLQQQQQLQQQQRKKLDDPADRNRVPSSNMKRLADLRRASYFNGSNQFQFHLNIPSPQAEPDYLNPANINNQYFFPNTNNGLLSANNSNNFNTNSNPNYHNNNNNIASNAQQLQLLQQQSYINSLIPNLNVSSNNNNQNQPYFRRNSNGSYHPTSYTNQLLLPPFQQTFEKISPFNQQQLIISTSNSQFMPLQELDEMKEFNVYYPQGNYSLVIERHENYKNNPLYNNKQGRLKKSVNKILQIRQLQDMILKRNHHNHIRLGSNVGTRKLTTIDNSPMQSIKNSVSEQEGPHSGDRNQEQIS